MSEITESFEELKTEASDLGIDTTGMKSKKVIKTAIDAYYASQSAGDLVEAVEEADEEEDESTVPVDETEEDIEEPIEDEFKDGGHKDGVQNKTKKAKAKAKEVDGIPDYTGMSKAQALNAAKKQAKKLKAKWMEKRVVTITNNDKRDSHVTTTCFLSAGVMQRIVPLDVPLELEKCLIKVAQDLVITAHVDEIINGARTGNKTPISVKKYGVSFQDNEL